MGAALTSAGAAWLIGLDQRVNRAQQGRNIMDFTAALAMLVFVFAVLPLASWLVLRAVRTPAPGSVMLFGWLGTLVLVLASAGGTRPYWVYGLCALAGYGLAGVGGAPAQAAGAGAGLAAAGGPGRSSRPQITAPAAKIEAAQMKAMM